MKATRKMESALTVICDSFIGATDGLDGDETVAVMVRLAACFLADNFVSPDEFIPALARETARRLVETHGEEKMREVVAAALGPRGPVN